MFKLQCKCVVGVLIFCLLAKRFKFDMFMSDFVRLHVTDHDIIDCSSKITVLF